jgi:hypothetical protein
MALITQIMALLETLTKADIEALSPVDRERLAQRLRHLAQLAERPDPPKGVLRHLKDRNGDC